MCARTPAIALLVCAEGRAPFRQAVLILSPMASLLRVLPRATHNLYQLPGRWYVKHPPGNVCTLRFLPPT